MKVTHTMMLPKREITENQGNYNKKISIQPSILISLIVFFKLSFAHDLSILPQMPDKLIIDSMTDVKTENAKNSK